MTDPTTTPPPGSGPPIAIAGGTPALIQAGLITFSLAVVTVVGSAATLLSFWNAHDMVGWINWLRSSDGAGVIAAIVTIVSTTTMVGRSLWRKWREIYLGRHTDNSIAYIKGEQEPPPLTRAPETTAPPTRLVPGSVLAGSPGTATSPAPAGKTVDQNDLLTAARNFQDASRALNGSSILDLQSIQAVRDKLEDSLDADGAQGDAP